MSSQPDAQRQLSSLPLAVLLLAPGQKIASANPAAEPGTTPTATNLNEAPAANGPELVIGVLLSGCPSPLTSAG